MEKSGRTRKITRFALLAALALALSVLENVFSPVLPPGAKAGISNIVVMFSAASYGLVPALILAFLKGVYALLFRGVLAFSMSLCGGICSAFVLWVLFRFTQGRVGLIGISIAGAFVHNAAQGALALLVFGRALLAYIPILLLLSVPSGIITGALLGTVLRLSARRSKSRKEKV